MILYAVLFYLPAVTACAMLIALWRLGDLSLRSVVLLGLWWVVALLMQFRAPSPGIWAAGLALQAILAVALAIRLKMSW